MKTMLTLLLLAPASTCFAQSDYTALAGAPTKLGDEKIPAYRTLADTAGKPFTNLFAHSNVSVVGRLGSRWAILSKGDNEYVVRTSLLPTDCQQVVASALVLPDLPRDPGTGQIIYSDVVQVPGASQTELYARAKIWFANTFKSAKDVVQADVQEAGVVQGTGWQTIYIKVIGMPSSQKLWYTVKLAAKDGRYKYEVTEFRIQNDPSQYNLHPTPNPVEGNFFSTSSRISGNGIIRQQRREVQEAAAVLISNIKTGMGKPAAGTMAGGKDW